MIGQKSPRNRESSPVLQQDPVLEGLRLEPKCDGTVIYQGYLHFGPESASCDGGVDRASPIEQIAEQTARLIGGRRRAETGPCALVSVCGESELRDEQDCAADLAQREIHPSLGVREDPVGQKPLKQPVGRRFVVAPADANQGEETSLDRADHSSVDPDRRRRDALNEANHGAYVIIASRDPQVIMSESFPCGEWYLPERVRKIRGRFASGSG